MLDTQNLQNCVNSTENCIHETYRLSKLVENLNTFNTLKVQNRANSTENCVHQIYRLSGFVEKFEFVGYTKM